MARNRFLPDHGLSARMGLAMFLNGLIYVVLLLGIWFIFGRSLVGVVFALIVSMGAFFFQWWSSDRLAMRAMRAYEVSPQQAPELHAVVDRLCLLANMPKPRVAFSESCVPNAFATGRSPSHSVVCVTRGLLETLSPEEVEVVLAHELSHIGHRDVTVMTVAGVTGVVAGLMVRAGFEASFFGGRNRNGFGVLVLMTLLGVTVYAVSFVLIRTLSRYRELAADRAAAYLTGQPSTLASALMKISGQMTRVPEEDLRQTNAANHLALVPAVNGDSVVQLFSTHPSLEQRLAQLQQIAYHMSQR